MEELAQKVRWLQASMEGHYKRADNYIAKAVAHCDKQRGRPVSCKRGCDKCCYLMVTASLPEIIMALFSACENGHADALMEKSESDRRNFERLQEPNLNTATWLDEQHPCTFLHDHECMCYDFRPDACRAYFVYSPVEHCGPPSSQDVLAPNTRGFFKYAFAELQDFSHGLGLPIFYAPLPFLVPLATIYLTDGLDETMDLLKSINAETDEKAYAFSMHHWKGIEL